MGRVKIERLVEIEDDHGRLGCVVLRDGRCIAADLRLRSWKNRTYGQIRAEIQAHGWKPHVISETRGALYS